MNEFSKWCIFALAYRLHLYEKRKKNENKKWRN